VIRDSVPDRVSSNDSIASTTIHYRRKKNLARIKGRLSPPAGQMGLISGGKGIKPGCIKNLFYPKYQLLFKTRGCLHFREFRWMPGI